MYCFPLSVKFLKNSEKEKEIHLNEQTEQNKTKANRGLFGREQKILYAVLFTEVSGTTQKTELLSFIVSIDS